ncbi:MAG: hypothetical protein ACYDCU_13370 [Candidatus Acidiferrales bacterium]
MRILKLLLEFVMLVLGSILAGYFIGTLQHYVAFGVWADGFGMEAFQFSLLEGGITGAMFGIPTGLIAYYAVLRRRVTPKQVAIILLGSLVGGCGAGIGIFWPSAFVTPILTIGIARCVKQRGDHSSCLP